MKDYSDYGGYGGYGDYGESGYSFGNQSDSDTSRRYGFGNADGNCRDDAYRGGRGTSDARGFGTYRENKWDADARSGGGYGNVPPDMQSRVEQYSSMSRAELSDELMREASMLRSQGLLDVNKLDEFCRMAAPYMNAEQVRRMREIIDMLR